MLNSGRHPLASSLLRSLSSKSDPLTLTYEETKGVLVDEEDSELDLDELDAAAGGEGGCFIIGGSNKVEKTRGHACAYVGVGWVTS